MSNLDVKTTGFVLQKLPFKERDLIVKLLSDKGSLMSVVFYGGRGGGSKKKSSLIEVGHCLNIQLRRSRRPGVELLTAKEWTLKWAGHELRNHHMAFYLMTFYFETILKLGLDTNLDEDVTEHKDIYVLLSNALFYLEKEIQQKRFNLYAHMNIFLSKLIYQLGILPELDNCFHCGKQLTKNFIFDVQNGGFSCCHNNDISLHDLDHSQITLSHLRAILPVKYSEAFGLNIQDLEVSKQLFHYYCYQNQFAPGNFKSLHLLF